MAPAQLTCRIRVEKAETYDAGTGQPENSTVSDLKDCPEVAIEIRTQWAREVVKCFGVIHDCIRPWDFIARLDGSVECQPHCQHQKVGFILPDSRYHQVPYVNLINTKRSKESRGSQWLAFFTRSYQAQNPLWNCPTTKCNTASAVQFFLMTLFLCLTP